MTTGVHYPHRIRLRGPWECEPLASLGGGELPGRRRMVLPCSWCDGGLPGFAGTVRFVRRFGYPGRIDDDERVWLTVQAIEGRARLWLNGQALGEARGEDGAWEAEVTGLLAARNELRVEVTAGTDRGGLIGETALEVRRTAYLRDVRLVVGAGRRVMGEAVGTAERPLEVYVLEGARTVGYGTVTPRDEGQAFVVTMEGATGGGAVRVELIDGGTVWYAVELGC